MKVTFYEEDQMEEFLRAVEERNQNGEEMVMKTEGNTKNFYVGGIRVGYKHLDEEGFYLID